MKVQRHVFYAIANDLLQAVIEKRGLYCDCQIKIMADGGQGFFKICLSVWSEDYLEDSDLNKKRTLYSEGGSCSKTAKLTGVNKLILLCIVPQIKETYNNVKLLFNLVEINDIVFRFVCDLKLLLIVNGQQTATSTYPCPYCYITLGDLRKKTDYFTNDDVSTSKTYKNLRDDYEKFCSLNNIKSKAPECDSTANQPIFEEADDICVSEKCPVPQLHLMQGFVNHLFWNGLVPLVGEERALIWPKKLNLVAKNYHGRIFEGNACREMLKKSEDLLDPEIYSTVGKMALIPYDTAFKALNKIVINCFSIKTVDFPVLKSDINYLKKALRGVDVSETLKIHIILNHIEECLGYLNPEEGLGL